MRAFLPFIFSVLFCACTTTQENIVIDGILEVPENGNNPDSRTLKLAYKVLKAKDTTSSKEPIVILQGGLGASTLIPEAFWENHPLSKS